MPEEVEVPVGAGLPTKRPGKTNAASKSCANACCASPPGADLEHGLLTLRGSVGAALCRERGAKRPQDFSCAAHIAGAALRPFRDTRPLLQRPHMPEEVAVPVGAGLPAKRPGQTNAASKSCANACCASPPGADLEHGLLTLRGSVGAALCRERGAKRPQDFSFAAHIAGAALRPFRDTRPLPQRPHMPEEVAVPVGAGLPAKRPGQTNAASKSCANACCASPTTCARCLARVNGTTKSNPGSSAHNNPSASQACAQWHGR